MTCSSPDWHSDEPLSGVVGAVVGDGDGGGTVGVVVVITSVAHMYSTIPASTDWNPAL